MSRLVKGVSRQVIVVKAPDPRFFEQAIFILKEDAFGRGVTADDVLQEARRVADGYIRRNSRWSRLWRHIPAPAYVAAGALGATVGGCVALVLSKQAAPEPFAPGRFRLIFVLVSGR